MREKKRKEIIESAIKLFAKRGSTNTSVQVIVDACGISKGSFYHYFTSKEELNTAIFQYYFEKVNDRAKEIEASDLSPREKMKEQLNIPFEQLIKEKEFLTMYMQEQNFPLETEVGDFKAKIQHENAKRYEQNLIEIYGEQVSDYCGDIILFIDGMRTTYIGAILFYDLQIDMTLLPSFMMNRIDDLVHAFENGEKPIIKHTDLLLSSRNGSIEKLNKNEKVAALLADMLEQLEMIDIEKEKKEGLNGVLDYLAAELKNPTFEKYVFQGMLANLKAVKEFDVYREKIADLLDLQLL